jgi:hypothetical protein
MRVVELIELAQSECIDCPYLPPPYFVRTKCPACDMKVYGDLAWSIQRYRITKKYKKKRRPKCR